jgi:hypothetical protein
MRAKWRRRSSRSRSCVAAKAVWLWAIPAAGAIVCLAWAALLTSYRKLNSAKFEVLMQLEADLPVPPFTRERDSAKTPNMSRNAFPAAVLVSIGCSVAFRLAPFVFTERTMSCKSPILRARRSILVTIRRSCRQHLSAHSWKQPGGDETDNDRLSQPRMSQLSQTPHVAPRLLSPLRRRRKSQGVHAPLGPAAKVRPQHSFQAPALLKYSLVPMLYRHMANFR